MGYGTGRMRRRVPAAIVPCPPRTGEEPNRVFGYFLEANGIPVAPIVLGMVLGPILEQNFMVSMIKTEWDLTQFFQRPIALVLGGLTVLIWLTPLYFWLLARGRRFAASR